MVRIPEAVVQQRKAAGQVIGCVYASRRLRRCAAGVIIDPQEPAIPGDPYKSVIASLIR